jgi:hypothetical protein
MKLIGVSGAAGAGKDEFAKIGVEEFGATRVAFADPLKEEVAEFLDEHEVCWEHRHLYGDVNDKEATLRMAYSHKPRASSMTWFLTDVCDYHDGYLYFTARKLLQYWGTEYRRNQDPNYWVAKAFKALPASGLCIITDMRFPNEMEAIQAIGGKTVRIIRPTAQKITGSSHASESLMENRTDWDRVLINASTLEDYHKGCRLVLGELLHEQ